jgi:hypothetical protein
MSHCKSLEETVDDCIANHGKGSKLLPLACLYENPAKNEQWTNTALCTAMFCHNAPFSDDFVISDDK